MGKDRKRSEDCVCVSMYISKSRRKYVDTNTSSSSSHINYVIVYTFPLPLAVPCSQCSLPTTHVPMTHEAKRLNLSIKTSIKPEAWKEGRELATKLDNVSAA